MEGDAVQSIILLLCQDWTTWLTSYWMVVERVPNIGEPGLYRRVVIAVAQL